MNKNTLLVELFRAYYDARQNKRNTKSAIAFEIDYEKNLFALCDQLWNETYKIGKSICFIAHKPVKREIFAGSFRDRIVHHFLFNSLNPLFEKLFINDSYSCRTGRGTSYGIKRLGRFIRSCSENHSQDCYVLQLDISGYFMSIDKEILFQKIEKVFLRSDRQTEIDIDFLLRLTKKIIFHQPENNCIIKGDPADWIGLPKSKSLFFAARHKGLPIGNLTSQLFGNVYLNDFDHYVKNVLQCRRYGRYVDDFFVVHTEQEFLHALLPKMRSFLQKDTKLILHPKKIRISKSENGVDFLGAIIKPYHVYIRNRTKGNFYTTIEKWNRLICYQKGKPNSMLLESFFSSINSYLGLMKTNKTYRIRKKILTRKISDSFFAYVRFSADLEKLQKRKKSLNIRHSYLVG